MAIRYWLLKTEPTHYSFEDLLKKGRETWDGITNPLALKHLRTARGGDLALIYHTGNVRAAVGIARVLGAAYPDPKKGNPKLAVIEGRRGIASDSHSTLPTWQSPCSRIWDTCPARWKHSRACARTWRTSVS